MTAYLRDSLCYYGEKLFLIDPKIVNSAVEEILTAVRSFTGKNPRTLDLLDVGSGRGEFTNQMAGSFKTVTGVEPYETAFKFAKKHFHKPNLSFVHSLIEDYKIKKQYDVAVALAVYEHMPNQEKSFDAIFKLLKPGGILYFTAPNKYWIFEPHYGLPFLSWLPLPLANAYLKFIKGIPSYDDASYSRGYQYTRSFFARYPCTHQFILPYNSEGEYFGYGKKGLYSIIKRLGIGLIRRFPFFWTFSKGFIIVCKKTK